MDTSDPMDCESSNTRSGRRFPPLPAVNLQLDTRQFNHNDDYYVFPDYPPLVKANADCSDWNYYARRTSQEVLPGLYLGPYASATRGARPEMIKMGLTHVVCVRSKAEAAFVRPNHLDLFSYLVLDLDDTPFQGIIPSVKRVITFLDECFKHDGRALVHGNGGLCRSAAVVIGYVMWRHGVSAQKAFSYVQSRRFCIGINDGFMSQLQDFEMMVKAMQVVPERAEHVGKRTLEDEGDDDDMNGGEMDGNAQKVVRSS